MSTLKTDVLVTVGKKDSEYYFHTDFGLLKIRTTTTEIFDFTELKQGIIFEADSTIRYLESGAVKTNDPWIIFEPQSLGLEFDDESEPFSEEETRQLQDIIMFTEVKWMNI